MRMNGDGWCGWAMMSGGWRMGGGWRMVDGYWMEMDV